MFLKPACFLSILIAALTLSLSLPAHGAGAAPAKGQARTLLLLTQEKKADGVAIIIKGDGVFSKYVTFTLENPPRLIIDFPGVAFPEAPVTYRSPDDAIQKIRVGNPRHGRTRVVFDFQGRATVPYRIVEEGSSLRVEFVTRKEENSTPQAKIVKPESSVTIFQGDTVSFAGTVTGGNEPVAREWTVSGNGISKTMPNLVAQKFDQTGTFTVTYRAADRDGESAADSVTVNVTALPAPVAAAVAAPAQPTVKPQADSQEPAVAAQSAREKPSAAAKPAPQEPVKLSLFFGSGILYSGDIGDLTIAEPAGSATRYWSLTRETSSMLTVGAAYAFTPWLEFDAGLSGSVGDGDTTLIILSAGPRLMLTSSGGPGAYLRAGPSYGYFDWKDAPGDFDNAVGWELGCGLTMPFRGWTFGLDLGYRDLSFDYNLPGSAGVTANDDEIDLSGFTASFMLRYPL